VIDLLHAILISDNFFVRPMDRYRRTNLRFFRASTTATEITVAVITTPPTITATNVVNRSAEKDKLARIIIISTLTFNSIHRLFI